MLRPSTSRARQGGLRDGHECARSAFDHCSAVLYCTQIKHIPTPPLATSAASSYCLLTAQGSTVSFHRVVSNMQSQQLQRSIVSPAQTSYGVGARSLRASGAAFRSTGSNRRSITILAAVKVGDKAPDFTLKDQVRLLLLSRIVRSSIKLCVYKRFAILVLTWGYCLQNGKNVKLSSFQGIFGKPVVLYFYPADNTPGCTKQANAFKQSISSFKSKGAEGKRLVFLHHSTQSFITLSHLRAMHHVIFGSNYSKQSVHHTAVLAGCVSKMELDLSCIE